MRAVSLTLVLALAALGGSFGRLWIAEGFGIVRPGYYSVTAEYLAGERSRDSYERYFSWRIENQQRLAAIIRADPERTLFVWGEYPWLYPLADAENPTRYPTSFLCSFVPGGKEEVREALRRRPPRYIAWERGERRPLPFLAALLAERYELVAVVDNTELYRRKDGAP